MPQPRSFKAFIRTTVISHYATLADAFNANTLLTILGPFTPGYRVAIEKLRFTVAAADFAGGGGTLTYELRKNSATGTAIAQLVIPLASALRGVTLEAVVTASPAQDPVANLFDTDTLYLVRLATGTVFSTGAGIFSVVGRQVLQARA